jgi:hypothetical protein
MTIKKKIWKILDEKGRILDSEAFKISKSLSQVEVYKHMWKRLKYFREFFKDKKIVSINKISQGYYAECDDGFTYKINKDYCEELKNPVHNS